MQKQLKKALLRKFLLDQCQKKRNHLPLQPLSLPTIMPPPLHLQAPQIETQNSKHNITLVSEP